MPSRSPNPPCASPSMRFDEIDSDDEGGDSKRARLEAAKRQPLDRISEEYGLKNRVVHIAGIFFHTVDEYQSDLRLDDHDIADAWLPTRLSLQGCVT